MKIENINVPYAQIPNKVLYDDKISWKAKGIFAYIQAKPNDWEFSSARMAEEASDGVDGTLSGIRELESAGYLIRQKEADGKVRFKLLMDKKSTEPKREKPVMDSTTDEKATTGKSLTGKSPLLIKKDILQTKRNTLATDKQLRGKKPITFKSSVPDISKVIKAMESVDPKNKLYYGNTTQMSASSFLIEEYGLDAVLSVIQGITRARVEVEYFPSITTPCELRDKWVKAFEAIARVQKNSKTKIRTESV